MPDPTIALLSSQIDTDYLLEAFRAEFPGARLVLGGRSQAEADLGELGAIDLVVCWMPQHGLMHRLPNLKMVQSVGAGIDHITADPLLPGVPICRIIDPEMASGMAAYVCWAVTHRQCSIPAYLESQRRGAWEEQPIVPARRHRVGIAGLGTLGLQCARALAAIGYAVSGWSRTPKPQLAEGIQAWHGDDQLDDFLAQCDTLVCLLPLTGRTRGILDARLFSKLPRGAHLINVGRGDHLVERDLLAALDAGQLGAATLDAFSAEPLPADHPFWTHPRVTVTPHIATRTPPSTIARQTRANYEALLAGRTPAGAMDRARGY
ncbi:MAG TPA: glyoxylate/hydroxypyruvate reductase A [Bordetella sp.]